MKGSFAMCVFSAAKLGIQGQRLRLVHNQFGTIFCDRHCHWPVVSGLKGAGEGSSLKDYSIGFTPYRLYSAYRRGEDEKRIQK